ncbi:alpha/beta fold hydrolase [Rhodococcus pyridinivorans]|uniref:thioesterase II family protein n=2 Tax=Nocardiaceae TaxID=85025 RepID=UPI0009FAB5A5|nr:MULTISPECIES: alpha/beta fold hydrolase [Rhodococcus]MCD2116031.1 alpha/beta fold hydrolase [Rhodococcus pyridinivorans]MCW3469036.1 alpha/beta fold hydrolase [Rhodococcus pyridinivorans]MCZ4624895.1 alpha/beta fold hydrolase [Rhodococcus pyridinivorans]MCZ4646105.1 alpha/beta fold hydrolase [Rhodococcus pyridinivorans]MDJ0482827.1 alpha/beta fold hydrolase [Rhodococcus pyridinivorans]
MTPTVVCFHHAGGSAAAYRDWGSEHDLRIHAVCLPGRDGRRNEPSPTSMDSLVEQLDDELGELLATEHVLFGHSMGGTIAYELALRRMRRNARLPLAMIVVASNPPHLQPAGLPLDEMTDLEIARSLTELGGIPPILLERPEWLGPLMRPVKDDLRLCRSARVVGDAELAPLPVSLHVIGGSRDRLAPPERLATWRLHAGRDFSLSILDGAGHFLVTENRSEVTALVAAVVDRTRVGVL